MTRGSSQPLLDAVEHAQHAGLLAGANPVDPARALWRAMPVAAELETHGRPTADQADRPRGRSSAGCSPTSRRTSSSRP